MNLPAQAELGCCATSADDVQQAWHYARRHGHRFLPLGAGSNVVPNRQVAGLVCLMQTRGIEVLSETSEYALVRVAAGENWHDFVLHSLQHEWYGLENLALIPGTVGAAPVQNIGAYGVELANFVSRIELLDAQGQRRHLSGTQCGFGYRDSVFKRGNGSTILSVTFRLGRRGQPIYDYPDLSAELLQRLGRDTVITSHHVADAVIAIRSRKLPTLASYPNAGSFFKNPSVSTAMAERIALQVPGLTRYPIAEPHDGRVKLSAAQLLDAAGWKRRAAARVACWHEQPLVLVNTGGADGEDVKTFAASIQQDILARYGLSLEFEPTVLS